MKLRYLPLLAALAFSLAVVGCGGSSSPNPKKGDSPQAKDKGDEKAAIRAALDKLSPEDRKLAEQQEFCAVMSENHLGSMGVPVKIEVKGEHVFLCCDACETKAQAHADRTLSRVKEFRERNADKAKKK